jgi:hypothetical protein
MAQTTRGFAGMRTEVIARDEDFLLKVEPSEPVDLIDWTEQNREFLEAQLQRYGAVVFRGFDVDKVLLKRFTKKISPNGTPLDFRGTLSPRGEGDEGIYRSTLFPKKLILPQHSEFACRKWWPRKLCLACIVPPADGGETPICSTRRILRLLDPKIVEKFRRSNILYIRNYWVNQASLSWQDAFDMQDPKELEQYFRAHQYRFEWGPNGALRTWNVAQGLARHPDTGEEVWFNHALNLSLVSNHQPAPAFRNLKGMFPPELFEKYLSVPVRELPQAVCYEDETTIELSILDELFELTEREKITVPWQKGDLLMVDNMLCTHGRNATNDDARTILVAALDQYSTLENAPSS